MYCMTELFNLGDMKSIFIRNQVTTLYLTGNGNSNQSADYLKPVNMKSLKIHPNGHYKKWYCQHTGENISSSRPIMHYITDGNMVLDLITIWLITTVTRNHNKADVSIVLHAWNCSLSSCLLFTLSFIFDTTFRCFRCIFN